MARRLLLCINDPDTTQLLTRALTREGYHVDACATLSAAHCAPTSDADVIVLDGSTDPGGGLGACRRIRDAGVTMPVLLLMNRTAGIDHVVAQESGATNCLVKPFRFADLLAALRVLSPQPTSHPAAQLQPDQTLSAEQTSGAPTSPSRSCATSGSTK